MPDAGVYDVIRGRLRDCYYPPGKKLVVHDVADSVGVSAIPVRECFIRLSECGMVNWVDNKGFYVPKFTKKRIMDDYVVLFYGILSSSFAYSHLSTRERSSVGAKFSDEIGGLSEGICASAVEELERFYRLLFRILDNPPMEKAIQCAIDRTHFYRRVDFNHRGSLWPHVVERIRFIEALERRDCRNLRSIVAAAFDRHMIAMDETFLQAVGILNTHHEPSTPVETRSPAEKKVLPPILDIN